MGQIIHNGRNYSGLINLNGVFIDTENVIVPDTQYTGSVTYTATQDCAVRFTIANDSNSGADVTLDGELISVIFGIQINLLGDIIYVKKGQTLVIRTSFTGATVSYKVYGIQPASNVTFISDSAVACYSTEERQIGCWVDGKPLYQKTWKFDSSLAIPANTWTGTSIRVSDFNFENIVSVIGTNADGTFFGFLGANHDQTNVQLIQTRNAQITLIYVTFQYTKTTDVAGSGDLTPTALPTVHYSDTEQVIGTWFGETLYQKTYTFAPFTPSSNDHEETQSIDTGIDCKQILNSNVMYQGTLFSNGIYPPGGITYRYAVDMSAHLLSLRVFNCGGATMSANVTLQYTKTS